jgi:hypothetical protein
MGTAVSRIEREFVLRSLAENSGTVEIMVMGSRSRAKIVAYARGKVGLAPEVDLSAKQDDAARVFLRFRGSSMVFDTTLLAVKKGHLDLAEPADIVREVNRGYQRVPVPNGTRVGFHIEGTYYDLDYPTSDQYEAVGPPKTNRSFDASSVAGLMKSFRDRSSRYATEHKIVMFRERVPTTYPERLMATSGKIVLLPLSAAAAPIAESTALATRVLPEGDEATYREEIRQPGEDVAQTKDDYLSRIGSRGVTGELYCPVLFHQYVVGYLYYIQTREVDVPFPTRIVEFVHQFSRILAHALHLNGYFQEQVGPPRERAGELIDMSGSGLLFTGEVVHMQLRRGSPIEVKITFPDGSVLRSPAEVRRVYAHGSRVYIGAKFVEMAEDDQQLLRRKLYGDSEGMLPDNL